MNPSRLVCSCWSRQVGWLIWPRCLGRLSLKRDLDPSALVCRAHVTCLSVDLVAIKLQNKKWIRKVAEPPWWKCKYTILRLSIIQVSSTMSQISISQVFLFVFGAWFFLTLVCLCVSLCIFVMFIFFTLQDEWSQPTFIYLFGRRLFVAHVREPFIYVLAEFVR